MNSSIGYQFSNWLLINAVLIINLSIFKIFFIEQRILFKNFYFVQKCFFKINSTCSIESFLIRVPPDHSLLPAPRSVSSVDTPFIASECQGIQLKPLFAYIILCFPLYSFQNLAFTLRTRD